MDHNDQRVPLTGLYNRAMLGKALKESALTIRPGDWALINVNLAGMDALSLRYGFHFNQQMIKKAADALSACCASQGCDLYQSYENRFTFFLRGYAGREKLYGFAATVTAALDSILRAYGIRYGIGILCSCAVNPGDVDKLMDKLLIASEIALRSDAKGKRVLFWGPGIEAQVKRESRISKALSRVISGEDEDSLSIQYQPIWNASSGKVYAFEALARLNTVGDGEIPPLEFIGIAEKENMIVPLGEIIVHKVLCFLQKLKERRQDAMAVSINISVIQLLSGDFARNLIALIRRYGIDPASLLVELTESVFSQEWDAIKRETELLKASGIKIMIDDFGTGYSSFERENELSIESMKIDKIFIDKLEYLHLKETIIPDMISMARKLGHRVVAEGVESGRQLNHLLDCGCDNIQGYLISKPLDEDDALAFQIHYAYERPIFSDKEEILAG